MSTTEGYSIWLMPSGQVYERLSRLISELSIKYSTPGFEPHVTLIGEVTGPEEEIIAKTSTLADKIKPFVISPLRIEQLDEYFRCIFIRLEESKALLDANLKARELFNRSNELPYMPHLSLVYGSLQTSKKKDIIGEIGSFDTAFDANRLYLFSTQGEPKNWYKLRAFDLKQNINI